MVKMDLSAERQVSALNMSKRTKRVKVIVVSLAVTLPSSISDMKMTIVPVTMTNAAVSTRTINAVSIIGSEDFLIDERSIDQIC